MLAQLVHHDIIMLVSLSSLNWACPFQSEWKEISMKSVLAAAATIAAFVGATIVAPTASADFDPHYPIPAIDYCPGGQGGLFIFNIGDSFCEGASFDDGTRWHFERSTVHTGMNCIFWTGNPLPPLAAPGGCGGVWQITVF